MISNNLLCCSPSCVKRWNLRLRRRFKKSTFHPTYRPLPIKKIKENQRIVHSQHDAEHDERHDGKQQRQRRGGEKRLDAVVIVDALEEVAERFGVEESQRHTHRSGEEVREQREVDVGA